jgi:CheY-like chemotaxis protein
MSVTECVQGADALAHFEDGAKFDLALIELRLSDMSGLDLINTIRTRFHATLPIALLVAGSFDHDRAHLASLGIYHSLLKPIKAKSLRQLTAILTSANSGESRPPSFPPLPTTLKLSDEYPLRILVAEDNLVNQRVAARTLALFGYSVDLVANGREAVNAARNKVYDVVLMDIQMPELDGYQASQEIRSEIAPTHQPWIIALTAEAINGVRERITNTGMNDYLSKPLDKTALERSLRNAALKITAAPRS